MVKTNEAEFLELSQELLNRGKSVRFRAHGRSMHPFIKDGDILIVEPLNGTLAKTGDIIFYRRPSAEIIAHRLIKIETRNDKSVLITKGDSLKHYDTPIPAGQVLGRVVRVEGRKRQLSLNNWPGRLFGFLIARYAGGSYPQKIRFIRNLGRLWWLLKGRRKKIKRKRL